MSDSTGVPGGPEVIVVGIGADGWAGLPPRVRVLVSRATVVLGGRRHLEMLPQADGQRRLPWPSPLRAALPSLLASLGLPSSPGPAASSRGPVVALASGDPLVSGIGATLLELLGPGSVRIEPAISSVALARARLGWPAGSCAVVSLVGRDPYLVLRQLAPGRRVLVLSPDAGTPALVAALLDGAGYGESVLTVLGDLGAASESRFAATAREWLSAPPGLVPAPLVQASHVEAPLVQAPRVPALHVLALELSGPRVGGWVAGLPDEAFEHDGQLTRRDLRAAALARLSPVPGEHLWDVGAGAGSVGIEWMRAHPACVTTAIEASQERAARIARNAARLGVPALTVVAGQAPAALAGLAAPDAVFLGGGATHPGVTEACLSALRPGGRLVAHGVTLETEQVLAGLFQRHGGELTRISVESAAPLGSLTGWTPARTITQWAVSR